MPWHKTETSHYYAQQGHPDKGRVIKELMVCWVLLILIQQVFGQKMRDLAPLSYPGLFDLLLKCQQPRSYEVVSMSTRYSVTSRHCVNIFSIKATQ